MGSHPQFVLSSKPILLMNSNTVISSVTSIRRILGILNAHVKRLEDICITNQISLPDLDTPFYPSSEAFRQLPEAAEVANIAVTAAYHLAAILEPPSVALYHVVGGVSSTLFVLSLHD